MLQNRCQDTDFHLNNQKKTSKMLHTCYIFLMWIVPCKVELTKKVIAAQESSFWKSKYPRL